MHSGGRLGPSGIVLEKITTMHTSAYAPPLTALSLLLLSSMAYAQEGAVGGSVEVAPPAAEAELPATENDAEFGTQPPVQAAQAEETVPEAGMEPAMPAAGTAPIADPTPPEPTPMEPIEEPVAEEEGGVPGWFRVDSDGLGLQLWFGATHDLGGINLATDIYVDSGTFGEFDLGVEIPIGEQVLLIPMIGIGFDWSQQTATTLIAPQLFAYLDFSPVYIEYWAQF